MKISILFASIGREILFDALKSVYNTTKPFDVEVILVQDVRPIEQRVSNLMIESGKNFVIDFNYHKRGAIWAWNRALQLSSGDIIVPFGDDQRCYPNWLELGLNAHAEMGGYGMVAFNDLNLNGETQLGTTLLYDRTFCREALGGVVAYPVYNYFFVDNELNERARKLGKYKWCKEAIVEHIHSSNGKRTADESDLERARGNFMELDKAIFEQRKEQGFPNNFNPVI